MKLLGIWVNGGNTLMTVPHAVASLDDFKDTGPRFLERERVV